MSLCQVSINYLMPEVDWLAASAGVPGQCSANGCIDLSKYPFMNTNTCICNAPALGQIAGSAGSAAQHYMRAAIGAPPALHPHFCAGLQPCCAALLC